jgi:hypothetical protein
MGARLAAIGHAQSVAGFPRSSQVHLVDNPCMCRCSVWWWSSAVGLAFGFRRFMRWYYDVAGELSRQRIARQSLQRPRAEREQTLEVPHEG